MRVRRRDRRMHQNHFKQYFKLNSIFICLRAPHANERCDNVEDFNVIYSRAILYQLTNLLSHIGKNVYKCIENLHKTRRSHYV